MITTDQILANTFYAFFYSFGDYVIYIWATALGFAIIMALTRILTKR